MTKDRINYRQSRKNAHGAEEVERAIGVTCTRGSASTSSSNGNNAVELPRPVALMKWAFDDYIVEEELPEEVFLPETPKSPLSAPFTAGQGEDAPPFPSSSFSSTSSTVDGENTPQSTSFVVQVLCEGVADTTVEKLLRERLPYSIPFHFLTPVDYVSCASRYVWLRCGEAGMHTLPRTFWRDQHWHTGSGDVYVSAVRRIRVSAKAHAFPAHLLPRTRYTVTLRNIQSSLGDVLPQLRGVAQGGFLNYSHVARHGVGLSRIYEDAKLLLLRDYPGFLRHHVQRLTEGTTQVRREVPLLLEVLSAPRSSTRDWKGVVEGMEAAVKADADVYARTRQSGLYPPHHHLLLDFVRRAADILPRHHDSAQLIREAVKPLVLRETLHAITDVHFNAMASLRWQRSGSKVVVGDWVRVANGPAAPVGSVKAARDCFVGVADHVNGSMTSSAHQDWSSVEPESDSAATVSDSMWSVKRVASKAEAANFSLLDVVLPTLGRGSADLLAAVSSCSTKTEEATLFANLASELRVEGLTEMNLAPRASVRPLVQVPHSMSFYVVDEKRGWDWEEDAGSTVLKNALYHDQDGLLRYRSPFASRAGKNMKARIGIRDEVARNFFLKPARKPGMTCVMQLTLPAGSHATSAIREAFMVATLSPTAIFRLLAR